jgi:V-containing nitrogenase delta subunit
LEDKALALYSFIQERYLWQFYSRTWDREENINNIMQKFFQIISDEKAVGENPKDQCFFAEAITVVNETKKQFAWLSELERTELEKIVESVKAKLIDVTITKSQNEELNVPNY